MTVRAATLCLIVGAMLASSIALVYVQHVRRGLFMELKSLEHERDQMDVEWGQLQLESSTLAAQDRIEKIATERLEFHVPEPTAMVLVRP